MSRLYYALIINLNVGDLKMKVFFIRMKKKERTFFSLLIEEQIIHYKTNNISTNEDFFFHFVKNV